MQCKIMISRPDFKGAFVYETDDIELTSAISKLLRSSCKRIDVSATIMAYKDADDENHYHYAAQNTMYLANITNNLTDSIVETLKHE